MQVWILTFNRPKALNRQIKTFGSCGYDVHIFSNHPTVTIDEENQRYVKGVLINSLADPDCNAWMARSWNSVYLKCFKTEEECMFVQDDSPVSTGIREVIENNKDKYDLIWGPQGDTFYYMKKSVLREVGWWDERYLGAYCSDADFLLRCWLFYDQSRLSITEMHDWGFEHNGVGILSVLPVDYNLRTIDETYVNQHTQMTNLHGSNRVMDYSLGFFREKWGSPGNGLNQIGCILNHISYPLLEEIDWYPWFTKIHLGK